MAGEQGQHRAMVDQWARRPALPRIIRQRRQFPPGFREQPCDRALQPGPRGPERRGIGAGIKMFEPCAVRMVDGADRLDPVIAPGLQAPVSGGALDAVAA